MNQHQQSDKLTRLYRSLNFVADENDVAKKKIKVSSPVKPKIENQNEELEIKIFSNNNDGQNLLTIDRMTTPWIKKPTLTLKNPSLRLHNEIIDFYQYISPSEQEHHQRTLVVNTVMKFLQSQLPDASISYFGSFRTKLYLPNADIDLVSINEQSSVKSMYSKVAKALLDNKNEYEKVNLITNAKVPIIKFVHVKSQLNFDLSFNKDDGLKQVEEIEKAFQVYPEMKFLLFIIKCMLRQRDLHETYSGGIGSFLLFQMILAFLREFRKEIGKDKERRVIGISNILLSEYLIKFFEFYGIKFDFQRKRITMVNGGSIQDKPFPDERFSLISPQDTDHDIGHSSYKIKEIFSVFKNRYHFMTNYSFQPEESVLKYVLNPSGQQFTFMKDL